MTDLTEPTRLTTRTPRRGAAAALIVLAWCAAVAVAATAGWLVVDRVGSSLLGGPGLNGVPAAGSTATSSGAAAGQPRTLVTAGGRVTAVCPSPSAISLQSAIPTPDWRVEISSRGPQVLNVEFRSGSRKAEVDGVCRSGVPVLTQGHGGASSGSRPASTSSTSSTSDDHGGGGRGGSDPGSGSDGSGSGGSDDGSGSGSGSGSSRHGSRG